MIDEEILAPLRGDPPGQPRIDVPRAMVEGLRRRRHRQWASGVAVAAAVALAATGGLLTTRLHAAPAPVATTPPPTSCTVSRLPTVDGRWTSVVAGDPTGYLLGAMFPSHTQPGFAPVIWKNGKIVARPKVATGTELVDINNQGDAVGTLDQLPSPLSQAYAVHDGRTITLPGGLSGAKGINDAGTIVGFLGHGGPQRGDQKPDSVPVRWSSPDAAPQKLAVPAGYAWGEASGIAANGTTWGVFGRDVQPGDPSETGALWLPDGTLRLLTPPPPMAGSDHFFVPEALVGNWLYGRLSVGLEFGTLQRARYNIAENRFEQLPDLEDDPGAYADNGWTIGIRTLHSGKTTTQQAILQAGPTAVTLPGPYTNRVSMLQVGAISPDGKSVAGSNNWLIDGQDLPVNGTFLWTCK